MQGRHVLSVSLMFLILFSLSVVGLPSDAETGISYHTSNQIDSILSDMAGEHPGYLEYTTAQDLLGTRDIEGDRVIPILFVGNRSQQRPWVMLVGAHHGDEPDSAEAVLAFSQHLLDGYAGGSMRAKRIVDNLNLAILPVVNPYGLDMLTRVDANGEDPNRDYPFEPSGVTSTTDGVPLTTAGAHAVHTLAGMYPFSVAISFHTGSKGIFHTWGAPNVGMVTPDAVCFTEVGEELSRSSGQDLLHGPANQYPYVADLEGAFDDHLYGSTFLPDRLYSTSMQLPWSTFTATVELDTVKGRNEANMGSMEGLWEYPVEDQGTVPMGVRICYSACQIAFPSLEVEHHHHDGNLTLNGTLTGALAVDSTEIIVDGSPYPGPVIWDEDPILPERSFSLTIGTDPEPGLHQVSVSVEVDGGWTDLEDDAYPLIGPQSLLARSRRNLDPEWTGSFEVEDAVVPEPEEMPSLKMEHDTVLIYDEDNHLGIDIDLDGTEAISLDIVLSDGDETVSESFGADRIIEGYNPYSFPEPPYAGTFEVEINLTHEGGYVVESGVAEVLPSVRAVSVEKVGPDGSWSGRIGADGVHGNIPVYWGVTRSMESPWSEDEWVLGPYIVFPAEDGITNVQMDLGDHGRPMYFHVTSTLGELADEQDSYEAFSPDGDVEIICSDPIYGNGSLTVGPVLIVSRIDGLDVLGPEEMTSAPISEVAKSPDERTDIDLVWVYTADMTTDQKRALYQLSFENGITGYMPSGAYFGNITFEPYPGIFTVRIDVSGNYTTGAGMDIQFIDTWSMDLHGGHSNGTEEDENGRKWISWQLIAFLVAVAIAILLVSYLRYDAHGRDPEPEEEAPRRRGAPPKRPLNRSSEKLPSARKIVRK